MQKKAYDKYDSSYCKVAIFFDWTNDGKIDHAALMGFVQKAEKNIIYITMLIQVIEVVNLKNIQSIKCEMMKFRKVQMERH